MKCDTCGSDGSYVKRGSDGVDRCPNCCDFSEAAGTKTRHLQMRARADVSHDMHQHASDTILPHRWDRDQRKVVVNESFVQQFPEQSKQTYSDKELKQSKIKLK